MNFELTQDKDVVRISLSGDLTIADAGALRRRLFDIIEPESKLAIAARKLNFMDTSIAQVLLLACQQAREVEIESHSSAWDATVTALGLTFANVVAPEEVIDR